jgi:hypothetical protein
MPLSDWTLTTPGTVVVGYTVAVARRLAAALLVTCCVGCAKAAALTSTDRAVTAGGEGRRIVATPADLAHCVAVSNRYRASVQAAPLGQSAEAERYAFASAREDHARRRAHHRSSGRNRAPGAFAENEALRWTFQQAGGSARTFIDRALAMMWAEGRGGGHYENIRGPWRVLGCALYADTATITLAQHFR